MPIEQWAEELRLSEISGSSKEEDYPRVAALCATIRGLRYVLISARDHKMFIGDMHIVEDKLTACEASLQGLFK